MAAPTSPYCDSADVAELLPQLIRNAADFSAGTNPAKTVVEKFIRWKSSEIDQAFAAVGFYVPFQEISGETWPEHQTYALELVTAMGAAGLIAGPVVKPAPAMGRQSGTSDNEYTASFKRFLEMVAQNGAGFRAYHRTGSLAEKFCSEPAGPMTDYLAGYIDFTQFQTIDEYTALIEKLRSDYNIDAWQVWDHLKTSRDALLS